MREIKLRGRISDGTWVYGLLAKKIIGDMDACYISNSCGMPFAYQILPETIGQFTGLLDKNGKEIYEGDVITNGDKNIKYVVEWHDCGLRARQINNESYIGLSYWQDRLEIIGNIYANPELLEEKKEDAINE